MPFPRILTVGLLAISPLAMPLASIASQAQPSQTITAQAEAVPTTQRLEACRQNQAERLPNPFTDVPRTHWAFKAVLTLHYCGADRQATSSHVTEPSPPQLPAQTPQTVP